MRANDRFYQPSRMLGWNWQEIIVGMAGGPPADDDSDMDVGVAVEIVAKSCNLRVLSNVSLEAVLANRIEVLRL